MLARNTQMLVIILEDNYQVTLSAFLTEEIK